MDSRKKGHETKPKVENPGKLFKRLMGYIFKELYTAHVIIVVICIIIRRACKCAGNFVHADTD